MNYFDVNISVLLIVLLGCTALFAIICAVFGLMPLRRVARKGAQMEKAGEELLQVTDEKLPSVSVVVYARNAEERIDEFIKSVLKQDYPDFEVIIVNDASTDMTRERVETMQRECGDKLKYTFVPESARNISRKKMAFALGIKGARGEVIVTTLAGGCIESDRWLRLMCAPFADEDVEMTLGYAYYPNKLFKGKHLRSFDTTLIASQWIGAAAVGKAFRGTEYNMAFRRHCFFDSKGYASSISLQGGHDDMFVCDVARSGHVKMVLDTDARVAIDCKPENFHRMWKDDKEHRTFMSRFLNTGAFRQQGFCSLCLWLCLACAVATIAYASPNFFPISIVMVILLALWGYQITLYRKVSGLLGAVRLWWGVPFGFVLRPLMTARGRARMRGTQDRHYTWTTGMKSRSEI